MALRLHAAFLLLTVALVLPVAGLPMRFCTCAAVFLTAGEACALAPEPETDCGCGDEETPLLPDCMTAAKALPDGLAPDHFALPPLVALDAPVTVTGIAPCWRVLPSPGHFAPDRAPPPGAVPLYLRNHSLLL